MARIVHEGTRVVVHVDGRLKAVLDPGRHRLPGWWWRRSLTVVDTRDRLLVVAGQEVAAADVPGLKISTALRWRVADVAAWCHVSADPEEDVRLALQIALRDWAAAAPVEQLVAGRAAAGDVLLAAVSGAAQRVGAEASSAVVRDIVVPGELRRASLSVAMAKLEGQATLERARAETAALRAAANGARLLAENPALLQLRTVEAAAAGGGQVVVRLGEAGAAAPPALP